MFIISICLFSTYFEPCKLSSPQSRLYVRQSVGAHVCETLCVCVFTYRRDQSIEIDGKIHSDGGHQQRQFTNMLTTQLAVFCVLIHLQVTFSTANNATTNINATASPFLPVANLSREKRGNETTFEQAELPPPETNQIFHVTPNDDTSNPSGPSWAERLFGTFLHHFMSVFQRTTPSPEAEAEETTSDATVVAKENNLREQTSTKKVTTRVFEANKVKTALLEGRTWNGDEIGLDDDEDFEDSDDIVHKLEKLTTPTEKPSELENEFLESACHMLNNSIGACQPTIYCMLQEPDQGKFAICPEDAKSNQVSQQVSSLPARVCCPPIHVSEQEMKQKFKDWLVEARTDMFAAGLPKHPDGRCGLVMVDQIEASDSELLRSKTPIEMNNKRIVDGRTVRPGEIPWMVQIYHQSQLICGGSIISKLHILTAAHCFSQSQTPEDYVVLYGDVFVGNGTSVNVASIKVHPRYRPPAIYGDLALLTLAEPIEFSEVVQPICLPGKKMLNKLMIGQTTTVAGFGDTKFQGPPAHTLQKVDVKVIEPSFCDRNYQRLAESDKRFPDGIGPSLICAGKKAGKKDACQGDSGGGLTLTYHKANYLVGIVSFGYRCALPKFPGIYTAVAHFNHWIFDNIST